MVEISTIGIDIAKNVFQVHATGPDGGTVLCRRLRRDNVAKFFASIPPCLVGIEACGTSHHWAREIAAFGHDVRLMPPRYVRPYVKRNKNDSADAEAICEAVRRPNMRFVPVKTTKQQAVLIEHAVRDLLVCQRTQLVNALRGHLAEFGIVAPQGLHRVRELTAIVDSSDVRLPDAARAALRFVLDELVGVDARIAAIEAGIAKSAKADQTAKRLMTIPGIGPIIASRLVATVADPGVFRSGRDLAAFIGLVPRQHSTGGRARLGRITKQGNGALRRLFVNGAMAAMRQSKVLSADPWLLRLRGRKPPLVVAVALANKMARAAWAVMTREEDWRPRLGEAATA